METTLLLTGFDPFGGEAVNPAWEAVQALPDQVGAYHIEKCLVPTSFARAAETVLEKAAQVLPNVILCIGQAGGRGVVTPERVAINCMDAGMDDNDGFRPQDLPVVEGGPAAYFATVPVKAMVAAMREEGLPAAVSNSAGTFVCNALFYRLLRCYEGANTRVGFLHVPYLPQQAGAGVPSLGLDAIVGALTVAIHALDGG